VWVFSILNHGRVTHGSGLYKAGVGLQGYNLISDNSVSEVITLSSSGSSSLYPSESRSGVLQLHSPCEYGSADQVKQVGVDVGCHHYKVTTLVSRPPRVEALYRALEEYTALLSLCLPGQEHHLLPHREQSGCTCADGGPAP
jgi:hypothetical protein